MKINLTIKLGEELNEFKRIANELMTNYIIVANNKEYNLVEIEFYYWSKDHEDPYIHKTEEQLTSGKWYFNGFGLDITFGKGKDIYGGILIRGVKSINDSKYYSGPSNVLKELLSQYDAFSEEKSIYLKIADKKLEINEYEPFACTRIGLTKKKDDNKNYFAEPYRFLSDINVDHKFKDKERVVRVMIKKYPIERYNIKKYLGYNIKA